MGSDSRMCGLTEAELTASEITFAWRRFCYVWTRIALRRAAYGDDLALAAFVYETFRAMDERDVAGRRYATSATSGR